MLVEERGIGLDPVHPDQTTTVVRLSTMLTVITPSAIHMDLLTLHAQIIYRPTCMCGRCT